MEIKKTKETQDWAFLAKHSLDVYPDLRDIQVDVALSDPPRIEIISGWDPRFDRMIYDNYDHKNYVRTWIPIILIKDKEAGIIKTSKWYERAEWEIVENVILVEDKEEAIVKKQYEHAEWGIVENKEKIVGKRITLKLKMENLPKYMKEPSSYIIGTIEAGYYNPKADITPGQVMNLAKKIGQYGLEIYNCLLPSVLETIVKNVRSIVNADFATLFFFFNPDRDGYVYKVGDGKISGSFFDQHPPRLKGLGQEAIETGEPRFLPDPSRKEDLKEFNPSIYQNGVRAMAACPLLIDKEQDKQKRGILYICFNDVHWFTEDEIGWIKLLASRAVDAIRHATHYKETRDSANRLANLHAVTESIIVGDTEMCYLLQRIAGNTLNLLTADLVTIYEYIETKNQFPLPPAIMGRLRVPREMKLPTDKQSPPVWLVENRRTLHRESVLYAEHVKKNPTLCKPDGKNDRGEENFVMRESIESAVGVLLKSGNEIVGVMFVNYRRHHLFSQDEKEILNMLTSTAAIAIQNRRLLNKIQQNLMDMAHQIQSPFQKIIGRVDSIIEGYTPQNKVNGYLRTVYDSVEDAWALSKGLFIALKRDNKLPISLEREKINVRDELYKICDRIKDDNDAVAGRNLKFEYNIISQDEDDNNYSILVIDRTILISVMYSLIINAIKYADSDSTVVFTLDLRPTEKDVVLKVKSTGIPIELREKELIFERFYRGVNVEKIGRHGAGLGLWVVKQLLDVIKGEVYLKLSSDQKRASEFIVHFPR